MSKNLQETLKLLSNASTDDEKLAVLFVVAKVLKDGNLNTEDRSKLFKAVGYTFLQRLLKTENTSEGCSKWTYKGVALSILSSFCTDRDMISSPEMLENLTQFNKIITDIPSTCPVPEAPVSGCGRVSEGQDPEYQRVVTETYECLSHLASQPHNLDAFISQHTVTALCQAVTNSCHGWQKAQQLLLYIVNMKGSETWQRNLEGLQQLLIHFTGRFAQEQDELKFGICSSLYILLATATKEQISQLQSNKWSTDLRSTLFMVLKNKLGGGQREPVLKLACTVTDLLGVEWTLSEDDTDHKFLLLLVHLCCIEVRMLLESDDLEKIDDKGDLLCACYLLLESVISYMSVCQSLQLNSKQIQQLHSAMRGAFQAIIFFLQQVQNKQPHKQDVFRETGTVIKELQACVEIPDEKYWVCDISLEFFTTDIYILASVEKSHAMTVASLRVLGAWIAEETAALHKEVISVLPFLLELSKRGFEPSPPSESMDASGDVGEEKPFFEDVLKFLLPGFCHLSSEEEARKVMVQERGHELLARYFSHQYKVFTEGDRRETEVSLTTLCGIFLNFIVMETELVSTDPVFSELLSFLITTLPSIGGDQLILAFNMCVMCLMLLRHHSNTLQVSNQSLDQLFTCVVQMLSVHELLPETDGQSSLLIKQRFEGVWSEVAELWFLGMQALNACVPLFPQLSLEILKAGWIPNVTQILLKMKDDLDDMTRDSYLGLLLQLAIRGGDVRQLILEHDGLRVAQLFGFSLLVDCLTR